MRKTLIILSFIFTGSIHSQSVKTEGIDEINKTAWFHNVTMYFSDTLGNLLGPADYERLEYSTDLPDRLTILIEGEPYPDEIITNNVPKQCIRKIKFTGNYSSKIGSDNPPDSILTSDSHCIDSIYLAYKDSFTNVTICVKNNNRFLNRFHYADKDYWLMKQSNFIYGEKDGLETEYYKIQELEGSCVIDNFRLKRTGNWKKGKKHGKWKYYNKIGQLTSTEIYKNGWLVKTK